MNTERNGVVGEMGRDMRAGRVLAVREGLPAAYGERVGAGYQFPEMRLQVDLQGSVYCPWGGCDTSVIRYLWRQWAFFVYADEGESGVCAAKFGKDPLFYEYDAEMEERVDFRRLCGETAEVFAGPIRMGRSEEWRLPLVEYARLRGKRRAEKLQALLATADPVRLYELVYARRGVAPACLVYHGGRGDALELARALEGNAGGLPPYVLCDQEGRSLRSAGRFPLASRYEALDEAVLKHTHDGGRTRWTLGKLRIKN